MTRWRAMSDDELAVLEHCARERKALGVEDRSKYSSPEAANVSISGALYWAIVRLWQDAPAILIAGCAILVWQLGAFALALV